jgi:S-DNA-T family DNA segregation ATPase FtsK/SpoIIIE
MAKKRTNAPMKAPQPTFKPRVPHPNPFLGVTFLVLSILLYISLGDYEPAQNSFFSTNATNDHVVGILGMTAAVYSFLVIGLSAWLIPTFCLWISGMFFFAYSHKLNIWRYLCVLFSLVGASVLLTLIEEVWVLDAGEKYSTNYFEYGIGGWVGHIIYRSFLHDLMGPIGSAVVFGALFLSCLIYLFYDNLAIGLWVGCSRFYHWLVSRKEDKKAAKGDSQRLAKLREIERMKADRKAQKFAEKQARREEKLALREAKKAERQQKSISEPVQAKDPDVLPLRSDINLNRPVKKPRSRPPVVPLDPEPVPELEEALPFENIPIEKERLPRTESPKESLRIIAAENTRKATIVQPKDRENYRFPPMDLLSEPVAVVDDARVSEYHQQTAEKLVQTLKEFKIDVTMGEVHSGPVITRYDINPAAGVRVEKIQNLDKNLALALKAMSVRILAPVPGKGCVGVEVPNKKPQSVFIRDILESEDWVTNKAEIPIALGKEVSGKPLIADLTKMPHLLIAGSTGSGKTVCINSVVTSLLYKMSPEDVRFVMVDPKIVEMQVYNALPHMMIPVVTDPKKVPGALKYLINEMDRRYHMFAKVGVRNIAGYNAKQSKNRKEAKEAEEKARELELSLSPEERAAAANASSLENISVPRDLPDEEPGKLPYIVCIVDELADLMMVAPADIETGIARLAQLARAAGIHLILATQRPSVNVITGVIKANLPSRIAFKVASRVDSRTILDGMGADQLIGRGDMLFLPPGSADLVRSQGAFVGDDEINTIVDWIGEQNGEPEFDEQFQRSVEFGDEEDGNGASGDRLGADWGDEMVPDAIDVLRNTKRASTSMLQRRLRIGYNRAARIMEILEDHDIVGPENGSSPREILRDLDSLY